MCVNKLFHLRKFSDDADRKWFATIVSGGPSVRWVSVSLAHVTCHVIWHACVTRTFHRQWRWHARLSSYVRVSIYNALHVYLQPLHCDDTIRHTLKSRKDSQSRFPRLLRFFELVDMLFNIRNICVEVVIMVCCYDTQPSRSLAQYCIT